MEKVTLALTFGLLLGTFTAASAQYQKMDNSQFLSAAGAPNYLALSWSRMLTNKTYFSISETYFTTDYSVNNEQLFSTDNFLTELALVRSWFRFTDVYLNGGLGGFLLYTTSKTIQDTKINDFSGGFDFRGELEYLPLWWLGITGEARQLVFIGSDFYDTRFFFGFGIRIYF